MSTGYRVVPSVTFQDDVKRIEEHLIQRELASSAPDDTCLFRFRDALERAMATFSFAPHTRRRSEEQREFPELVIPFGHGGCVALLTIRDFDAVLLAARKQLEHDCR